MHSVAFPASAHALNETMCVCMRVFVCVCVCVCVRPPVLCLAALSIWLFVSAHCGTLCRPTFPSHTVSTQRTPVPCVPLTKDTRARGKMSSFNGITSGGVEQKQTRSSEQSFDLQMRWTRRKKRRRRCPICVSASAKLKLDHQPWRQRQKSCVRKGKKG